MVTLILTIKGDTYFLVAIDKNDVFSITDVLENRSHSWESYDFNNSDEDSVGLPRH